MKNLTDSSKCDKYLSEVAVTDRELKLLKFIRAMGYGQFTLFVQEAQPVRAEEAIKSTKF